MLLYPAIDLLNGRCVRLAQGRFEGATVYGDEPLALAAGLAAAGAQALHVVDLAGSRDGAATAAPLVRQLAALPGLAVQVGGGIRSRAAAEAYAAAGAARVALGSLAVRDPVETLAVIRALGPARVTLALDVRPDDRGGWVLAVAGWTEEAGESPWRVLERFLGAGGTQVLCTDISRDGMLAGPSLALYALIRQTWPAVRLTASGGVARLADLAALRRLGASGVIVGKALYEGCFSLGEALAVCRADADRDGDEGGRDAGGSGAAAPVGEGLCCKNA